MTSAPVRRPNSRTVASMMYSPPSIGQHKANVGSVAAEPVAYVALCCVCGCKAMCKLCKASSNISSGGRTDKSEVALSGGSDSGAQRISKSSGSWRVSASFETVSVSLVRRTLGFSESSLGAPSFSGASDGGVGVGVDSGMGSTGSLLGGGVAEDESRTPGVPVDEGTVTSFLDGRASLVVERRAELSAVDDWNSERDLRKRA